MKLEGKYDLEFYDGITQSILVVDDKNKIIHVNAYAKNLLSAGVSKKYIGEDINRIIRFKNIKTKKDIYINFFNVKSKVLNVITEMQCYISRATEIRVGEAYIDNQKCRVLLISSSEASDGFINLLHEDKELNNEEPSGANFNYININDTLMNYDGENISPELSTKIINSISTGVIVEKNSKITSINNSAKIILGCKDENGNENTFLGKNILDVVKIEPIKYNDVFIEKQYNSSYNIIERTVTRKDGSFIYCEITTMSFYAEEDEYHIYLFRDITKKVKVEKIVINNRNSYMKLLEILPIGVMLHTNNKFNSGNRAQAKLLGVDDINSMTSNSIYNMIHYEDKELYKKMYQEAYFAGKTTDMHEVRIVRNDGSVVEVEMVMMNMNYEWDKSVVILSQEITDRKRAQIDKLKLQQTLKYDQLKNEFISNVSHELKTPLNIILSTIQLLQYNYKDSKDEQLVRYLDLTKTNSYRLLRLINNLIDGTRIDVGNLKMNFRNYNIVKIVEDITMEAVEYVEEKGLSLTFDTNVEEKIIGVDKENIERIVLNLLSNAVKFSKENGTIEVQVHDLGNIVQIKVRDDGKGISDDAKVKIFDKFVQVEDLFTRTHEGSGVGLSLVKSIVETHSGNIYVNSKLGEGSEFIVELPDILSKHSMSKALNIAEVSSTERVRMEFSDIYI